LAKAFSKPYRSPAYHIPNEMKNNRREFIKKGSLIIVAAPLIGISSCKKKKKLKKCTTSDDILGPYHRDDAPYRNNLNVTSLPGTPLTIQGSIYGTDCDTPIIGATVDVWHADDSGDYDNSSSAYALRGRVITDSNGQYQFNTLEPGQYLLGGGNNYRPSHIHFKITATGHDDLITQLYFEGDPFISSDSWASEEDAEERIIPLREDGNGNKSGTFDIRLMPT